MTGKKSEHEKAVALFNDGWDHFLNCMNFGQSAMDAEAIGWMNDISIEMSKLREPGGDNDKT